MPIKDTKIFATLDKIGEHYNKNISNRYLRNALLHMTLSSSTWDLIESVTQQSEYHRLQGYHFDELYERILAFARFVYHARREILPNLRSILRSADEPSANSLQGNNRIIRDMVVNNFNSNLSLLSDLINELYVRTVELDNENADENGPVHRKIPELKELGRYLIGR